MISHAVTTRLGFFIIYICFSCPVGDFALHGDSVLNLLKLLWMGSSVLSAIHEESVLIKNCYILLLLVDFQFIFDGLYQILCKASVVQYSAFPRDPRKPVLLSTGLVRLNAGTVELFIFRWAALHLCMLQRHQPLHICGLWWQHCTVPDDWRKTFCHPVFVWVDTSLLLSRQLERFVFFNSRYLTVFPGIPHEK